uniref:Putative secreted cysteine rich protein n=1 Tax=Ixodes scapularis TaxID=6945 RepID=Q4PMK4_IXOSC|nr:putative secreted cysteine rich protein [Ixodes scapularis]
MFKLKFFILFALAGLCFGDSSDSETGEASPSGSGDSDSDKMEESTNVSGKNGEEKETEEGANSKEKEGAEKGNHPIGYSLPTFIGDSEERRKYATTLLSTCSTQPQEYKINENKINFTACTYTCLGLGNPPKNKDIRIPKGMACNEGNMKCPEEGPCPEPPLPSC